MMMGWTFAFGYDYFSLLLFIMENWNQFKYTIHNGKLAPMKYAMAYSKDPCINQKSETTQNWNTLCQK